VGIRILIEKKRGEGNRHVGLSRCSRGLREEGKKNSLHLGYGKSVFDLLAARKRRGKKGGGEEGVAALLLQKRQGRSSTMGPLRDPF